MDRIHVNIFQKAGIIIIHMYQKLSVIALVTVLFFGIAAAVEEKTSSGTVAIESTSVGVVGVGFNWGDGKLKFKGKEYHFSMSGLSLLDFGVSKVTAMQLFFGKAIAADRTHEIGVQAYIYAYPMIMMEITRRVSTNVEAPIGPLAPMNQFAHLRVFPDHTFKEVVRPNADTLYSIVWFNVSKEPQVLSVSDTGGRYYMLPMLDMWTDVIAAPGSRTSGTKAAIFAIVGPKWQGGLPDGVEPVRSPTNVGWIIGRTQTNGAADYENVHRIQDGYKLTPLSQWGKSYMPPAKVPVNSTWDMREHPIPEAIAMCCTLTKANYLQSVGSGRFPCMARRCTSWITPSDAMPLGIVTRFNLTKTARWISTSNMHLRAKTKNRTGFLLQRVISTWSCEPIGLCLKFSRALGIHLPSSVLNEWLRRSTLRMQIVS